MAGRDQVSLADLEKQLSLGPKGASVEDLRRLCGEYGLHVTALRTDIAHLSRCATPSVLHVNGNHFVTVLGWENDRLILFDNSTGVVECSREWFMERYRWEGVILMYGPPSPAMAAVLYSPAVSVVLALVVGYALLRSIRWARGRKQEFQTSFKPPTQSNGGES